MSSMRHRPLTLSDERFLMVRTLTARCAPGVRTTSPTKGWYRLILAADGIILVRTPHGQWCAPARTGVWVPPGVRAELETRGETDLRMIYTRQSRAAWNRAGAPDRACTVAITPLLRELLNRVVNLGSLDRRIPADVAIAQLVLAEVRGGATEPLELIWPRDDRAVRIAAGIEADPANRRSLQALCRGHGISVRTAQRVFPLETGLPFEQWRSRFRYLHATRLLAEDRKVSEVAAACGYRSVSAFVAAFARLSGTTPGDWRRKA
jgi:AraC-like DNA-binding protein